MRGTAASYSVLLSTWMEVARIGVTLLRFDAHQSHKCVMKMASQQRHLSTPVTNHTGQFDNIYTRRVEQP